MKSLNRIKRNILGQGLLEYAILMVVMIVAIVFIGVYIRRAISGNLKQAAGDFSGTFYNPNPGKSSIGTTLTVWGEDKISEQNIGDFDIDGDGVNEDEISSNATSNRFEKLSGREAATLRD